MPLTARCSVVKVHHFSEAIILKKASFSRISETLEKPLMTEYFHAYGNPLQSPEKAESAPLKVRNHLDAIVKGIRAARQKSHTTASPNLSISTSLL